MPGILRIASLNTFHRAWEATTRAAPQALTPKPEAETRPFTLQPSSAKGGKQDMVRVGVTYPHHLLHHLPRKAAHRSRVQVLGAALC